MFTRLLSLFLFSVLFISAPAPGARAAKPDASPEKAQTEAYLAVIKGDTSRDNTEWRDAIRWYRNAMALYESIRRTDPAWHPDVIQYRLAYCANEIAWIVQETGKTEAQILAGLDAPPAAPTNVTAAVNAALTLENELLRTEIDRLNAELQARPVADSWEAELRREREDRVSMAAQLAAMSNKLASAAEPSRKDIKEAREKAARLEGELEAARKREKAASQELERQAVELKQADALKARVAQLSAELDAANSKQAAEREQAVKDLAALRSDIERHAAEARQMAELTNRIAALAADNASLRASVEKAGADLAKAQADTERFKETAERQASDIRKMKELRAATEKAAEEKEAAVADARKARDATEQVRKQVAALLETIDRQAVQLKKVDELKAEISKLEAQKEALRREADKSRDELARVSQEKRVEKLEQLVVTLRNDLKATQATAEMLQAQVYKLQEKNTALERENAKLWRR
jgi:DNA repair exonuclease SbcCD ATPase subunit